MLMTLSVCSLLAARVADDSEASGPSGVDANPPQDDAAKK